MELHLFAPTAPSVACTHAGTKRTRAGFTLIELLIVVAIIAVLAGLIVLRLGNVDKNSRLQASIANLGRVSNTMDLFKTVSGGKIPDGFDSLLGTGGTAVYAGNGDATVNTGVNSGWLTVGTLTSGELGSLRRVASTIVSPGGPTNSFVNVYDHDTSATVVDPHTSTDNSAIRALDTTGNVAFVNKTSTAGIAIYKWLNLDTTDTSFRLLALGVGSRCTLVGRNNYNVSMPDAPVANDFAPNNDLAYRRPIILIRVSDTSQYFAEFMGTVTAYGKTQAGLRAGITK